MFEVFGFSNINITEIFYISSEARKVDEWSHEPIIGQ